MVPNHSPSFYDYVGVDISKDWLACWLQSASSFRWFANTTAGFMELDGWLRQNGCTPEQTVLCMENTGLYGHRLLAAMSRDRWHCSVEKTTILEKVAPEDHRKNDHLDARLLAEYAQRYTDRLHLQQPPERALDELDQLYSERQRLVRQKAAVLTKQKQADYRNHQLSVLWESWRRQIARLTEEIEFLEETMHQVVTAHQGLKHYYRLLVAIPGVGKVTGWLWLILFYGQTKLKPNKVAARFGFAPLKRESGTSVQGKTRSSGHGNAEMRRCMALAASTATTRYEHYQNYKQRKLKEGKRWPVIRNNTINKLIHLICTIWNTGRPYDPNYTSKFNGMQPV